MYNFTFPGHVLTLLGQVKVKMFEVLAVFGFTMGVYFAALLKKLTPMVKPKTAKTSNIFTLT